FFSSRRRHTSSKRDWSSDVCSSDLKLLSICCQLGFEMPKTLDFTGFFSPEASLSGRAAPHGWYPGWSAASPDGRCPCRHHRSARSEERRVGKECRWGGETAP